MTSFAPAFPSILALVAAVATYLLTRGEPIRQAKGTLGFAVLTLLAGALAVVVLVAVGVAHFRANSFLEILPALVTAMEAIQAVLFSRTLPSMALISVIGLSFLLLLLYSTEIREARLTLFPLSRVVADGPWQGAFLSEAEVGDLLRLKTGLPLGLSTKGRIVRYAKNDAHGWLGGHHAVISATRGGKGVSAIIPAIFDHDGPVVALDIKGELIDITGAGRAARGQRVVALDPFRVSKASRIEGQKPLGFNPMAFIRPDHRGRDAAVLAEGLVIPEQGESAHFSDRARACIQTTIEVVHELSKNPTLHEVRDLIQAGNFLDTLEAWTEAPQLAGGRAANLAGSFLAMGDKERGSILSTAAKALEWTSADAMRKFLGVRQGFDLESLLRGDRDLFIVVPLDQVGAQAGFMRLMANLLLALMVQQGERQSARRQVLFVADEFTRLGRLEKLSDIATVAAGINLEALFILQDKGSLEEVYKQEADTILASCATIRVFNLGRGDIRTAEWASKLTGYKTLRTQSVSTATGSKDTSTTSAETKEPLLSASDILELPTDQMICFIRGRKPLRLNRITWFQDKRYSNNG